MPRLDDLVSPHLAAWNAGDLDGYLAMYADGIRLHGYSPEPMDKAGATGFYRMIWSAFPAPSLVFHDRIEEGDRYVCRFTMSGRHEGEFMGVPATGNPIALDGITILRFEGRQCAERWSSADMLGLLVQIGAVPAPVAG